MPKSDPKSSSRIKHKQARVLHALEEASVWLREAEVAMADWKHAPKEAQRDLRGMQAINKLLYEKSGGQPH